MMRVIPKAILAMFFMFLIPDLMYGEKFDIAIFDPVGNVDGGVKSLVREMLSEGFVNQGSYNVLERAMIDEVLAENRFQMDTGLVSESELSMIGAMIGADVVSVSQLSTLGDNFFISGKVVDVNSARVITQSTCTTKRGLEDLYFESMKLSEKLAASGAAILTMSGKSIETVSAFETNSELEQFSDLIPLANNGKLFYAVAIGIKGSPKVEWDIASSTAEKLNILNMDNWRLPSREELGEIYRNKELFNGIPDGWYWSGTASGNMYWTLNIQNGSERRSRVFYPNSFLVVRN